MKGFHWVTDAAGKRIAVQLDIEEWGELIEDLYDGMLLDQRRQEDSEEPPTPLEDVIAELQR